MSNSDRRPAPTWLVFLAQYSFWIAGFVALFFAYIIEAGDVEMFRYVGF